MEIEYNFLNYNIKIVKSHYIFEIFYNFYPKFFRVIIFCRDHPCIQPRPVLHSFSTQNSFSDVTIVLLPFACQRFLIFWKNPDSFMLSA